MREFFWKTEEGKKSKRVSLGWISAHIDMHAFYEMHIGVIGYNLRSFFSLFIENHLFCFFLFNFLS
jgi:hypothetical protein